MSYNRIRPYTASGGGGGGGAVGPLTIAGQFYVVNGQPWTVIESTDFSIYKNHLDGIDITPVLGQRRDIGFNMLRVWLLNASVMPEFSPRLYPQMYARLPEFMDLCGRYGQGLELTAFTMATGPTGLMNDEREQHHHWDAICTAARGVPGIILEPFNEGDQYNGSNRPTITLLKPEGVISNRGSNGSDSTPPNHGDPWDEEVYHILGNEYQRKTGHNSMENADQSKRPCRTNESQRFIDNDQSENHAEDAAENAALLCAGSVFHSQQGKASVLFTGQTLRCAEAHCRGARKVPLEFQQGRYIHHDEMEAPGGYIRVHSRKLPDGREYFSKVRP